MLRKDKDSKKPRLPTEQEFLEYIPIRKDYHWKENNEGKIVIEVPKFESNIGKSFLNLIKKENKFTANLDRVGSYVWKNCDGKTKVKDILKGLEKKFPDEKGIDQRLFLFLTQLKNLNYIDY